MRVHYLRLALLAALYTTQSSAVSLGQDEPTKHRLLRPEVPDATAADNEEDQEGVVGDMIEERGQEWLQKFSAGLEHVVGKMLGKQSLIEKAVAKKAAGAGRQGHKKAAAEIKKLHRELVKKLRVPAPVSHNKEQGVVQTHPDMADLMKANLEVYHGELVARRPGIIDAYKEHVLDVTRKNMKAETKIYQDFDNFYGVMSAKDIRWSAAHDELDLKLLLAADVPVESFARVLRLPFESIKILKLHQNHPTLGHLKPLYRIFLKYEWMKVEKDFYTSKMKKALPLTAKVHPL